MGPSFVDRRQYKTLMLSELAKHRAAVLASKHWSSVLTSKELQLYNCRSKLDSLEYRSILLKTLDSWHLVESHKIPAIVLASWLCVESGRLHVVSDVFQYRRPFDPQDEDVRYCCPCRTHGDLWKCQFSLQNDVISAAETVTLLSSWRGMLSQCQATQNKIFSIIPRDT
jgi:hypothetical protein